MAERRLARGERGEEDANEGESHCWEVMETQIAKNRVEGLAGLLGFNNKFAVPSSGRSGGLCIFSKDDVNLVIKNFSQYHIDSWISEPGKDQWRLTCFYGEANRSLRFKTWDTMKRLRGESTLPWVCIGDFNEILRPEEQMGPNPRDSSQIAGFRDAVDICGLSDLGYKGLDWTFEKRVAAGQFCRVHLDRALATTSWSNLFPFASVEHLTAVKSDHNPILLLNELESTNLRFALKKPFRYECAWETDTRFQTVVEEAWRGGGAALSVADIAGKLELVAATFNRWGRSTFGSVRLELRQLRAQLTTLRADPMRTGPGEEERKVEERMIELCYREEIMQRQRSRVTWLSEGDNNTQFFQRKASARRAKNRITQLERVDGSTCTDLSELADMAKEFYGNLYTSEGTIGMEEVLSHIPVRVDALMNARLNAEYSKNEVKEALFQMFPTKAPGPDGFPAHFFQRHWELCGDEVTRMIIRVLSGEDSPEDINKTFIVMIPKIASPKVLGQFRPISLCNVIYKIASKVLANRLKDILPNVISEEQSAFVPGRLITDNFITAYECLHYMKTRRVKGNRFCALKLDMMKAYDRLEWPYLRAVMIKLGISPRFTDTIMRCVSSVSFSVLFNGGILDAFRPTRGLRQGDPISPYLFLLAAEGLSCILKAQGDGVRGVSVAPKAPLVNHLLFADDSLLFFEANPESATRVRDLLRRYCHASGQRINVDKSSIYFSKGVAEPLRASVKQILQVQNESLSEKYLGLPSDVGNSKEGSFKYLKDRIWKCVQGWMEKCLSVGGKEVLIKSVVQSIPTYSMACFKLPRGLCEHLNGLIRKFWWGSKNGQRKPAWVSWNTMSKPKFMGGMGFRDIELFNLALLARQAWSLMEHPESLSARVLKARYFPDCHLLDATLGSVPSQVWRAIMEGREILSLGLIKRIGNGVDTHIWLDNWLPRDFKLRPICPRSSDPPTRVSDLIDPTTRTWNRQLLEEHLIAPDVDIVLNIPLSSRVQEDFWAWHYDKRGIFSVRSAYRMITAIKAQREDWVEHRSGHSNSSADKKSWTFLWKVKIPSKIRVFVWRLAHTSLPTGSVRCSRNMSESDACSICGAAEDTWRHSLFDCQMARCTWALGDEELLEHVLSNRIEDARLWLFWLFETLNQQELARVLVTLWAIWWARRRAVHDNEFQSPVSTWCFINRFLEDLEIAAISQQKSRAVSPVLRAAPRWIPPVNELAKLNVDGGLSRQGNRGAAAVVCRDHTGRYLGASAVVFDGLVDPVSLEAHACNEALALAADLHIHRLMVASDCLEVVKNIKKGAASVYAPKMLKKKKTAAQGIIGPLVSGCHLGVRRWETSDLQ